MKRADDVVTVEVVVEGQAQIGHRAVEIGLLKLRRTADPNSRTYGYGGCR
jgi:hypothetical protein